MDFEFSDDQEQLRAAVRKWVNKSYSFERRRAIVDDGGFSHEAYVGMADLGLSGLYVPEDFGGLGMGPIEAMVVMEELGRGIVLEPIAHILIAGRLLSACGDAALQALWCPRIVNGEALVVLAHVERHARYRLDLCDTVASQEGGKWMLSGAKSLVPAGDRADAFIVPASVQGQMALFLVPREVAGVSARSYLTQDGSRSADIMLDHAPADLVTKHGFHVLEYAVDMGIAAQCAEAVGVMDKTLAATVEYLTTRKQFGVEIRSFQALRHRLADMKMYLELARSMSYYASLKLDDPAEERRRAVSSAKYQLCVSMRLIGQEAVQLHGAIGMTDEYIVSHYFKKLTQMEMTFGDALHHLSEVSTRLQDNAGVLQ